MTKREITEFKNKVVNAGKVIVFGAGGEGNLCVSWLKTFGITPDYMVDNNLSWHGNFFDNIEVKAPQEIMNEQESCVILICNKTKEAAIRKQLKNMGAERSNTILSFSEFYRGCEEKMISNEYNEKAIVQRHKKTNTPKVSIIVPVYKVDKYLTPCLNSIVNQTMEEIEIIIVDEGDVDRCREIIDYFERIDPRIVAPHIKHGGYGRSCNYGIDIAKGEYMIFVESDDKIRPQMCEELWTYAKELDADVVKTPYIRWDGYYGYEDCYYRIHAGEQLPQGSLFSVKEFDFPLQEHASLWSGIYKTSYMRGKNIRFIEAKGGAYVDVGFRIDTLINTEKMAWLDIPYYIYRTTNEDSTTNKFNLTSMLQRWNEAHVKFKAIQDDYDRYFGKALLFDEYLNTLSYVMNYEIEPDEIQRNLFVDNFSYINEEVIKSCKRLEPEAVEAMLELKRDPDAFFRKYREEKEEYEKTREKFDEFRLSDEKNKEMEEIKRLVQDRQYYKKGLMFFGGV